MRLRRGFTLLEVLLAIGLLLMLAGSVGSFVWNLLDRRTTLLGVGREVRAAAALLDRIEGDLLGAVTGDSAGGAGIVGTSGDLRVLTRGVWIDVGGGAAAVGAAGDLQRCEYRFEGATARVLASRSPATGSDSESDASAEVVSERVERLRFRYFDGREWRDSFDSAAHDGLPVAVEVALWLAPPGVAPRTRTEEATTSEAPPDFEGGLESSGSVDRRERATEAPGSGLDRERWGEPDRLRVIVVPDGPVTSWREGS